MARADAALQRWLGDLPFKVRREMATAIKREADGLAEKIKAAAPIKTGKLRDSVRVRRKRNDTELEVTAGGDDTAGEVRSGSGVNYDYARAVEFGTVKMPAQPFFYATFRENRDQIRENINAAIEEAIRKA